jgi:hypothetical protein
MMISQVMAKNALPSAYSMTTGYLRSHSTAVAHAVAHQMRVAVRMPRDQLALQCKCRK